MKSGKQWIKVKTYDDEDNVQEFLIKVEYEYEAGYYYEGRYEEGYSRIDVLEYPNGINEDQKKQIDESVIDMWDDILIGNDDDEAEMRAEAQREEEILKDIDTSFLNP